MVTAIVLLNVKQGKVTQLAEKLAELAGVSEVYSVGGRFDLVALLRVTSNEDLAQLVTDQIGHFDEISHTETLVAFKVFSKHDLESMFSLGL